MEKEKHLAIASVPIQEWNEVYDEEQALRMGTIFPELNRQFFATVLDNELENEKLQFSREETMLRQIQQTGFVLDNLLRMIKDPEVRDPLKFLRAREIVHFQRFGEALERTKNLLDSKNYYFYNPEFDKKIERS